MLFKKIFLICCIAFAPSFCGAYESVVSAPVSAFEITPIENPRASREFFGMLNNFPHTFEFVVTEKQRFEAKVSVPHIKLQDNTVSIIIVKEEKRGVSEVGRTKLVEQTWEVSKDSFYGESFRNGGGLSAELEPGIYRLEVSSPNNAGIYRLTVGTEKEDLSYFDKIHRIVEVKQLLGKSGAGVVFSPLVYVPLLLLIMLCIGFILYRKKHA